MSGMGSACAGIGRWGLAACLMIGAMDAANAEGLMEQTTPRGSTTQTATFAGGCFWCMEPPFEKLEGVRSVIAGYTGGTKANPTYQEVSSGVTGHAEAVQIAYDPSKITYEQLLDAFWMNVDPTTPNAQFADKGSQYRTAIFCHSEEQRRLAEASKERLARSGKFDKPLVTEIAPASAFYPAEDYHQDYYKKNAVHYTLYRAGSGREGFLKRLWGGH